MLIGSSIVAGFLIGLGVLINTLAGNPVLGSFLFSFGLLTIIQLQLPLYTGQIGFAKEKRADDLLLIFIFNAIGILICFLTCFTQKSLNLVQETANIKFSKDFLTLLCNGFACGILIHLAVKCKEKIITIMAVMIFILVGAEHCIADIPYLILNLSWINFLKYLVVIFGNSIGALFIQMCLSKGKKDNIVDLDNNFTITTTTTIEDEFKITQEEAKKLLKLSQEEIKK